MSCSTNSMSALLMPYHTGANRPFILHYGRRQLLIPAPLSYNQIQLEVRRHFPEIPRGHRVSYHTDELVVSRGALVEVSPQVWKAVIPLLTSLVVRSTLHPLGPGHPAHQCASSRRSKGKARERRDFFVDLTIPGEHKLVLRLCEVDAGDMFHFTCPASMPVGDILSRCIPAMNLDPNDDYEAWFKTSEITRGMRVSLEEYGLKDGDLIDVRADESMAKPVIYLFPPAGSDIDASVTLSLIPHWRFSAIYPVVPVESVAASGGAECLRWEVRAVANGILLEKQTGLEVAYLYWEAKQVLTYDAPIHLNTEHHVHRPVAPVLIASVPPGQPVPSNPDGVMENDSLDTKFNPSEAQLEPSNSVVLKVENITTYLDNALKALGLHTEARTSFITYWLPSFLKHKFVTLRFLPQSQYEHAAPLDIAPKPDVVLRVFMLFKGLQEDEVADEGWSMADVANVKQWRSVVGVDEKMLLADTSLFRVVEWGGMEVH